ncbi:MAG TPA: response regulator [Chloroflexi bacterium]|nr:response regulator [Chloroflexota bacterium]
MSEERKILIVDGDVAFSTILKEGLEQEARYQTIVTSSAREALAMLENTPFDLVIVDLGLDDPDGGTFALDLRKQHPDLNLMLIPMMGEALPAELSDLDVQGILTKPFFFPELPGLIGRAMGEEIAHDAPVEDLAPASIADTPLVSEAPEKEALDWGEISARAETPPAKQPAVLGEAEDEGEDEDEDERLREVKDGISEQNMHKIVQAMNGLAQDINADAVILTCANALIAHAGLLTLQGARDLAQVVGENWCTSLRIAEILGQKQSHFEQSIDGGAHLFYSFAVLDDIVLSTALSASVPLGMIRHSTRSTAAKLKRLIEVRFW